MTEHDLYDPDAWCGLSFLEHRSLLSDALLQELAKNPEAGPDLEQWDMHVIWTRPYGPYPALSLYYKYDEEILYPVHVESYDPLRLVNPADPDDA